MARESSIGLVYAGRRYTDADKGLRTVSADIALAPEKAASALKTELEQYLHTVALEVTKRHSLPWRPGSSPPDRLFRRAGNLTKAIRDSVRVSGEALENIEGRIGASVAYAMIQEYGGTVHPKHAKYLAIPLPSALDANGVPLKLSPRQWANTFVAKSRNGHLLVFQKRLGRIIPLYVLKSKVTIPARLGLRDELQTGIGLFADRAMNAMVLAIVSD